MEDLGPPDWWDIWWIEGETYRPERVLVSVNAISGIELLNWRGREVHRCNMISCSVFRSNETLYEHLINNLGIECPKYLDYWAMMKLLRTV